MSPPRTIGRKRPAPCLPMRLITITPSLSIGSWVILEFRKALLQGGVPEFTCLVGTMVQETYETTPPIREACKRSITGHAATLEADIEAAMRARNMAPDWTAKSLALHTQAVIQGAFILAKATGGAEIAADSIDHLIRYLELLFSPDNLERQS